MKKNRAVIYIITVIPFLISCDSSIDLSYSNYPSNLMEELVDFNTDIIDNQLVILPVIINGKKEEICINSASFHQKNRKFKNFSTDFSVTLLTGGLKGRYIQDADIFNKYVIDQNYYNNLFESSDLEEVLKDSMNPASIGSKGNYGELKFSIQDMKYIAALIKYLAVNKFSVSEGSYSGGYRVMDLTKSGRLAGDVSK